MISFTELHSEIEKRLQAKVEREFGPNSPLKQACLHAVGGTAKRLRPLIVLLVAQGLNRGWDVWEAALGVEFFHTASLIADDLPCMDNDEKRRNQPALHRAFPESVALLASYSLIAAGYETICQNQKTLLSHTTPEESLEISVAALENATKTMGVWGATGGQFLDLFSPNPDQETLFKIFAGKTAAFFEVAFVWGWLFGGGSKKELEQVKMLAHHWGLAFQIADDFEDVKENKGINMVTSLGEVAARQLLQKEHAKSKDLLQSLSLNTPPLLALLDRLVHRS